MSPAASKPALRARFLDDLPDHAELRALGEAFERGNYALVRRRAPQVIQSAEDDAVRAAAQDLLERLEPDPLMKYLLGLSVLLLLGVIAFVYAVHG